MDKNTIKIRSFGYLPKQAKIIREEVFCKEQGFKKEFDEHDQNARHYLLYFNKIPVGTCRTLFSAKHGCMTIGRVAILKKYRAYHLGKLLIEFAEKKLYQEFGHIKIGVDAQLRVCTFYEKSGYVKTDDRHFDEYCPHVWLEKTI